MQREGPPRGRGEGKQGPAQHSGQPAGQCLTSYQGLDRAALGEGHQQDSVWQVVRDEARPACRSLTTQSGSTGCMNGSLRLNTAQQEPNSNSGIWGRADLGIVQAKESVTPLGRRDRAAPWELSCPSSDSEKEGATIGQQ